MQDTRLWHSGAANQTEHERTAVVCRYAPWWLSGAEFGNLHSGRLHAQDLRAAGGVHEVLPFLPAHRFGDE